MGSVTVSGWSSPESISEDLAEPGTRRYDMATGLGGIKPAVNKSIRQYSMIESQKQVLHKNFVYVDVDFF